MGTGLLGDSTKTEVFDFQIFLDAIFGTFAAQAGLLDAAEGSDFGGDEAGVDADDAVFEGFGDTPDAGDVAAIKISGEAEFGVVGEGDGFGFAAKTEERCDGAESFFAGNHHLRSDFRENSGLEETAAE